MPRYTDQMGRAVELAEPPRRIVSLVPSQTELLFALGLDAEVVGVTRYCIAPADRIAGRARVGGTKDFDPEAVADLKPDLIIGAREENDRQRIERLQQNHPVWLSDVTDLDAALDMIQRVGVLVNRPQAAADLTGRIASAFADLPAFRPLDAAYLVWRRPYLAAGLGTFIDDMMRRCGLRNICAPRRRYPEVIAEDLAPAEVVLLSSEPFPFDEKHVAELGGDRPDRRVLLIDGTLFSWYGSRLVAAPAYFTRLRSELEDSIKKTS